MAMYDVSNHLVCLFIMFAALNGMSCPTLRQIGHDNLMAVGVERHEQARCGVAGIF